MKQIVPFILIAVIVAGAMFFLNDSYEEERIDPFYTYEESSMYWKYKIYLEEVVDEEAPEIGVRLEFLEEEKAEEIDALEFFVDTQQGGFYFQDLDIEEFDGVITYSELCDFCEKLEEIPTYANLIISWRQQGELHSDYLHFNLDINEQ